MKVLQAFQAHYPQYFKDKSIEDRQRMLVEWFQLWQAEDDRTFLRACGEVAKKEDFFPSPKKINDAIDKIKKQDEWEALQAKFRIERDKELASLTEERISILEQIDSMLGGERIDWRQEKAEAQQRLLGAII